MKYGLLEVNIPREGIARKNEARNIDSYETNENRHRLASGGSLFDASFAFTDIISKKYGTSVPN